MRKRKIFFSGMMMACMLFPAAGALADCYCGCNIAIQTQTTAVGQMFEQQNLLHIDKGFKALTQTVLAQTAAQKSMNENLYKNLEAALIRVEDARATANSQRRLMSQAFNPCSGRDVASAAASGAKAGGVVREQSNRLLTENGEGTKNTESDAQKAILDIIQEGPLKDETPIGHDFFPASKILDSANTRRAEDTIVLMMDPYPNPKVADENSFPGVQAKMEQRVKQSRLAIAMDTLHAVKADSDALVDAALLDEYVNTSHATHVQVPKDASGKTSMSAYYDILGSKTRIMNPNWHQYLMGGDGMTDEIGVLREIAQMVAIQLSIEVDIREWLKRIAALIAEQVAMQTETSNDRILGKMFAPGMPSGGRGGE